MTLSSEGRYGWLNERLVFIHAALLAADAAKASSREPGFTASDARFFFLLFTNWSEQDVMAPGQDIELTQMRRVLERFVAARWVAAARKRAVPAKTAKTAKRGGRFALTEAGRRGLAESVSDALEQHRPFEEALFVVCFAASYGAAIRTRMGRASSALDPHHLVARARRDRKALLEDLEERIRSGRSLAKAVARADRDALRTLDPKESYQLHRVRALPDILDSLPEDVRHFEVTRGISVRIDLLFEPLAARTRAELTALDKLEAKLTA